MGNFTAAMELRYLDEGQARILIQWKNQATEGRNWREWCNKHIDAKREIRKIFHRAGFLKGKDLNIKEIHAVFEYAGWGQGGRALNRTLYETNGLKKFNRALRELLNEYEPLPKRFENFLNLKGVGIWTASQILCKWYPETYPFIATTRGKGFMDKILFNNLHATRLKLAQNDAIKYYDTDPKFYSSKTLKYLTYSMILKEIRDFIELESFLEIQNVLWHAYDTQKQSFPRGTAARVKQRKIAKIHVQTSIPSIEEIAESSRWAVEKVIAYEELQGRKPHDVSDKPRGYDIESVDKNSGEVRYIEVKSRRGDFLVVLTDNEFQVASRLGQKYFLYVVTSDNIYIIRNPAKICSKEKNVRIVWTLTDWFEKGKKVRIT